MQLQYAAEEVYSTRYAVYDEVLRRCLEVRRIPPYSSAGTCYYRQVAVPSRVVRWVLLNGRSGDRLNSHQLCQLETIHWRRILCKWSTQSMQGLFDRLDLNADVFCLIMRLVCTLNR